MKSLKRRRFERKTDYKARFGLLKSGKPRLVVRKTNKYLIVQFIQSKGAQDSVVYGTTSKVLLTKGWPAEKTGSLKSVVAAYLTGYHAALEAKSKIKEAIFDMGMHRNIHKSRIYAVLKGAVDAGLTIPVEETALPTIEHIKAVPSLGKLVDTLGGNNGRERNKK